MDPFLWFMQEGNVQPCQIRERMLERFPCFFAQPELSSDNAMGIAVLAAFAHEETCLPMK